MFSWLREINATACGAVRQPLAVLGLTLLAVRVQLIERPGCLSPVVHEALASEFDRDGLLFDRFKRRGVPLVIRGLLEVIRGLRRAPTERRRR